jgi:hemerythrin-like metal-binding protein
MMSIDIFPWDNNFNTGLPRVDEQHRKLVQLLNLLASHVAFKSDNFQLSQIFEELADYAVYHFETEEAIWGEHLAGDSSEIEHRATHASFVQKVAQLKADQGSKPLAELIEDTLGFLARWLASHILESDRYMAYASLARQEGMSIDAAKQRAKERMGGATRALIDIILSIYSTLSTNTLNLMRELAEHKQAQDALRRESEKTLALLRNGSDGIHILDLDGNAIEASDAFCDVECNQAAIDMLAYPDKEALKNWKAPANICSASSTPSSNSPRSRPANSRSKKPTSASRRWSATSSPWCKSAPARKACAWPARYKPCRTGCSATRPDCSKPPRSIQAAIVRSARHGQRAGRSELNGAPLGSLAFFARTTWPYVYCGSARIRSREICGHYQRLLKRLRRNLPIRSFDLAPNMLKFKEWTGSTRLRPPPASLTH